MRIRIALLTAFILALAQTVHAQPALAGDWEADDDCIFDFMHFDADGTAKQITFENDGTEIKVPGKWAFDGARVNVTFDAFPEETWVGVFGDSGLAVTYDWTDNDNQAHHDTCILNRDTN